MNTLKKILLVVAVTICFSMTASAQRDDRKTPPKEGKPPVIPVQPKPTPDKPKDDRKRPGAVMFYFKED